MNGTLFTYEALKRFHNTYTLLNLFHIEAINLSTFEFSERKFRTLFVEFQVKVLLK